MAKWLQRATEKMEKKGTKGLFRRQAERHGMSTEQWASHEKDSSNPKQRERATFAQNAMRASK